MVRCAVVFVVLGVFATTGQAALVSVDLFQSRQTTVNTTVGDHNEGDINAVGQNTTDDPIGVWDNGASTVNWWNYGTTSGSALVDADGTTTGVSYAIINLDNTGVISGANNWTGGDPKDDLVQDGYYANGGTGEKIAQTTISGLTVSGEYNLLVYHADDHPSESISVNGTSASDYTGSLAHPNYDDAFDGGAGDFWYFSDVTANGSGQLVITSGGSVFNTISGFQVQEVPEPNSIVLVITSLAGIGLIRRRRRR